MYDCIRDVLGQSRERTRGGMHTWYIRVADSGKSARHSDDEIDRGGEGGNKLPIVPMENEPLSSTLS